MLIRSIFKKRKAVKENNNIPNDVKVYSQELKEKKDDIITINPTMYTEHEIIENVSKSEKSTAMELGSELKVKEYFSRGDNDVEKNIEDSHSDETVINPCQILKKNRPKEEKKQGNIAEKSVEKTVEKSVEKSTERSKEKAIEKSPEKAIEKTIENNTIENSIEHPANSFIIPPVPEIQDGYSDELKEILEKVNDLSNLIYDVTTRTHYLTQKAVSNLSEKTSGDTQADSGAQSDSSYYASMLAADTAKLSELVEELKNKALKLKY